MRVQDVMTTKALFEISETEQLGDAHRREVDRIDLALARMEHGLYGECSVCRAPIDTQRLRSVPDTDRCGGCASSS